MRRGATTQGPVTLPHRLGPVEEPQTTAGPQQEGETDTKAKAPGEPEKRTSTPHSEISTTQPSAQPSPPAISDSITVASKTVKAATRSAVPAVPVVPVVPVLPRTSPKHAKTSSSASKIEAVVKSADPTSPTKVVTEVAAPEPAPQKTLIPPRPAPVRKSWADMVSKSSSAPSNSEEPAGNSEVHANGKITPSVSANGFGKSGAAPVGEAIAAYRVAETGGKRSFLEPRGLKNTGNLCYMNSVSPSLHATQVVGADPPPRFFRCSCTASPSSTS